MQTIVRRIVRRSFPALAFVAGATSAVAQDTGSGPVLRLADIYRIVDGGSPRLVAARAAARAAAARVGPATLPPDPQVQFALMNRSLPSFAPMPVLGMNQIQVMQMVPTAGKLAAAGRSAAATARAAEDRASEVRWEARANAAMAFYDLYAATRTQRITERTRELLRGLATSTRTMYSVGTGRQADVLRAEVEIAKMTEDIIRMETMRTAMAAQLDAVLDAPIATARSTLEVPDLPPALPPIDSLQDAALRNRGMLRAARAEIDVARAGEQTARKELWPDLTVGVQYGWQGNPAGGTDHMGSLMFGATVPIFAAGRQLKMRQEAAAMRQMAEADLRAMAADTRARVATLYATVERSRHLITLYQSTVLPEANATVTSSLTAYRVGSVDFMTLVDNTMTVNRYQQELIALAADEGKAVAELEMMIGRALIAESTP